MYAIYLRKSREDKDLEALGEGETLARHKRTLQELARKDGYKITKIYEEIVSGSSIEDRPQMRQLLNDVRMKKYKGVLVIDTSRLARGSTTDQGIVSDAFNQSNTLIITPSKIYEPTSKTDRKFLEYNLFFAKQEYEFIRERLQAGIDSSFDEGNYVGSKPPYGYNAVRINKRERTLIPNDNSKYVQMIFKMYVHDDLTAGQIARKLSTMNIPSPSGRKVWSRETVKDILKNHTYIGKLQWNKRTKEKIYFEDGTYKKVTKRNTQDSLKVKDGKHEPIIDEELFRMAQEKAKSKNPVKLDKKLQNPLARIMVCKKCGRVMALASNRGKPRYVHAESIECKVKSAKYEDVMDALLFSLKEHVEDFEMRKSNDNDRQRFNEHESILKEMQSSLKKLEVKRERLFDSYEEGLYTKEEFLTRKNIYNEKINELEDAIGYEIANAPVQIDYNEEIIKFSQLIETLKSNVFSAEQKNKLLKQLIDKIEYECEDLGRNKGGIVKLAVYLRS